MFFTQLQNENSLIYKVKGVNVSHTVYKEKLSLIYEVKERSENV